jgi:hypothetical protein
MCSTHAADHKGVVCLSHRVSALRKISFDQYMMLSDEETGSGLYMIDIDLQDRAKHDARQARDFRRDHDEELDGAYR